MSDDASYLLQLLERQPPCDWARELRAVLASTTLKPKPDNPQECLVRFALAQARRHLAAVERMNKRSFGIAELVQVLERLSDQLMIRYFFVENDRFTGTCYVSDDALLGCEFIEKGTTVSKPGLWIDGKQIS